MSVIDFKQFAAELADAYEHIYDLVYLRSHSLIRYFFSQGQSPPAGQSTNKENAWLLHHMLLDTIQELDPGPQAPTFSREWRRYRLMILRYVDGLLPQAVADQLAVSRRHYYREHEGAIDALANILWKRYQLDGADQAEPRSAPAQEAPDSTTAVDRMELIRLEMAQLAQIDRRTRLPEVVDGILSLLHDRAQQHGVALHNGLPTTMPDVWGDHRLIRQLLLGLIGHLINVSRNGLIDISVRSEPQSLALSLAVQPGTELVGSIEADSQTPLAAFEELAALSAVTLALLRRDEEIRGFTVNLALYAGHRVVLVVDDNEDILELFQRYLKPHQYEVITVRSSAGLLELARNTQPSAIILDLMIPDQDGWDLLQLLLNHPETQSTPIIICSVLRQRELALSLGATAFLEKPVSEDRLLAVLEHLQNQNRSV